LHAADLKRPGAEGIARLYGQLVPQFSGMNFTRFRYAPGLYSGRTNNTWAIGLVKLPCKSPRSEFGGLKSVSRRIHAGEVVIVPPESDYSANFSTTGEIEYVVLTDARFKDALAAQHQDLDGLSGQGEAFFNSPVISSLQSAMLHSVSAPATFDPHHADNFVNAMVSEVHRKWAPDQKAPDNSQVGQLSLADMKRIDDYIEAHIGGAITNSHLSSLLDLPEAQFIKTFKTAVGHTPYQYVLAKRVELARHLLQTTSQSIASIAYSTGFSSQSHMTDVLRSRVGATPGLIRKGR